jgi:hypothetical protein
MNHSIKNSRRQMIWYVLFSVLSVGLPMASDLFCHWIKYVVHFGFLYPYGMLRLYLILWMPVLAAVLLFVKLMLQQKVSRKWSLMVNLILAVLMACMFYFIYPGRKLTSILGTFQVTSFIFVLQLCALIYDLFFRKKRIQEKKTQV